MRNGRAGSAKIWADSALPCSTLVLPMKKLLLLPLVFTFGIATVTSAAEKKPAAPGTQPAPTKFSTEYEGNTYNFPDEASLAKWKAEREASIYHQIGGNAAIDAAVEAFYVKVLKDDRIKHFFDDVDMVRQRTKQKQFLSAAFGGPIPWTGKDMRAAHKNLTGLNESHFAAVAENLQKTLVELKVPQALIDKIMAIAASTHDDVLNKPKK